MSTALSLFDDLDVVKSWAVVRAPAKYTEQFRRIGDAAIRCGVRPEEMATHFHYVATCSGWAPATQALYAKVARYAGLSAPLLETPEPEPWRLSLSALWNSNLGRGPYVTRNRIWCALASVWPGPIEAWSQLHLNEVHVIGPDIAINGRRLRGGAALLEEWIEHRSVPPRNRSPFLLVTLHSSRLAPDDVGSQLSVRGLRATFAQHVRSLAVNRRELGDPDADKFEKLSYDSFRRLLQESGVAPVERGGTRAARQRTSSATFVTVTN